MKYIVECDDKSASQKERKILLVFPINKLPFVRLAYSNYDNLIVIDKRIFMTNKIYYQYGYESYSIK